MSNLEIIKKLYQYFAERDEANIRNLFAADIEWKQMEGFPGGGTYRGADAIFKNVFNPFRQHWKNWKATVIEYQDAGEKVIVFGKYEGTFSETSQSMTAEFAHVYTIDDRQIVKFAQYTDTAQVAKAMGMMK